MTRSRIAVSANPGAFKTRYRDCPSPVSNGIGGTKNARASAQGMRPGSTPDPREAYKPCTFLWGIVGILVLVSTLLARLK